MNILLSDGHAHFHTVYLLNNAAIAKNDWYYAPPSNCYSIVENPSNIVAPVSAPSGNGVTITANIYKPIYVWVYKKGTMRTYTYSNSSVAGKSTLNTTKDAYSKASTGEQSAVFAKIGTTEFGLELKNNAMQICSVENPDYEPISPWGNTIRIEITKHRLEIPAPASSFGIGIGWYSTHISPARDLDKAIRY